MKYLVLTMAPGGGRKKVYAELDEKGLVNVDINAGDIANVLSIPLSDFVSMQIGFTAFNKDEEKGRVKIFTILNVGSGILNTNAQNIGNGLSFDVNFNKTSENMNIEIQNNNSYNITVSVSQKLLGN